MALPLPRRCLGQTCSTCTVLKAAGAAPLAVYAGAVRVTVGSHP